MAQREYIPILDDGEIISTSPLIVVDTIYYELWLNVNGSQAWEQHTFLSPLDTFALNSPAVVYPCVVLEDLFDSTLYNFKIRRFNSNNEFSAWSTGSFTTGS